MDRIGNFLLDSVPEKQTILSITAWGGGGVNAGMIRTTLSDPKHRSHSQKQIVSMVNKNLPRFNEGRVFAIEEQTIAVNRRGGLPVQFVIQNNDFSKLEKALPQFLDACNKSSVFQGVDVDLKFNKPEISVGINREKASEMGISVQDVAKTLQLALSNQQLGYFNMNGKQYPVIGQVSRANRDDPADLKKLYVRSSKGMMISLDNLVSFQEGTTPSTIFHFNRYKSATVSAGLAPGKTVGDGIKVMRQIAASNLDQSFATSLAGASRDYAESSSNTGFAFFLALALIFLVLAAQFESFIDPFIIMITVPLAIAGAILSLWMFNQTLNIFSEIGMIMLIGLVTKNGILIVEFANQNRLEGMGKVEAVIFAATQRLRPILMTSMAMALGALPLALSIGAASTSRIPLGIVIVGGIIFSLFLTLFVIPAMYSYMSSKKKKSELDNLETTKKYSLPAHV
ncbi:MAG: hypothetical protein NVS9B7_12570 [Flavisolibacter sp.]